MLQRPLSWDVRNTRLPRHNGGEDANGYLEPLVQREEPHKYLEIVDSKEMNVTPSGGRNGSATRPRIASSPAKVSLVKWEPSGRRPQYRPLARDGNAEEGRYVKRLSRDSSPCGPDDVKADSGNGQQNNLPGGRVSPSWKNNHSDPKSGSWSPGTGAKPGDKVQYAEVACTEVEPDTEQFTLGVHQSPSKSPSSTTPLLAGESPEHSVSGRAAGFPPSPELKPGALRVELPPQRGGGAHSGRVSPLGDTTARERYQVPRQQKRQQQQPNLKSESNC